MFFLILYFNFMSMRLEEEKRDDDGEVLGHMGMNRGGESIRGRMGRV